MLNSKGPADLQTDDKRTMWLQAFPQAALNLYLSSHNPDYFPDSLRSGWVIFSSHQSSSRATRQEFAAINGTPLNEQQIASLKTFLNDSSKIFYKGIVCHAVIRVSILVERMLKQIEHPSSKPRKAISVTAIGMPPMNMINGPWILLKSCCRNC